MSNQCRNIHNQAQTQLIESLHRLHGDVAIINQHCFSNFKIKIAHRHPRPCQHCRNAIGEIGILKTSA